MVSNMFAEPLNVIGENRENRVMIDKEGCTLAHCATEK